MRLDEVTPTVTLRNSKPFPLFSFARGEGELRTRSWEGWAEKGRDEGLFEGKVVWSL